MIDNQPMTPEQAATLKLGKKKYRASHKFENATSGRVRHVHHIIRAFASRSTDKRLSALSDPADRLHLARASCRRHVRAAMYAGTEKEPVTCSSWRLLWAYGPLACAASH